MVKDTLPVLDSLRIEHLETELAAARRKLKHRERLHRAHMQLAARVHQSLLPRPVRHPRVDLDTRYVPVEGIGGADLKRALDAGNNPRIERLPYDWALNSKENAR